MASSHPLLDGRDIVLGSVLLPGATSPVDVEIRAGHVESIGDVAPDLERVDLAGRHLRPALWDSHVHFTQWVRRRQRFDLAGTASADDVLARVRAVVGDDAPVELVVGYGFRDALWPDAPLRSALDDAAHGGPVALVSGDLHCGWLSSSAARLLGVETDESGVLREADWFGVLARVAGEESLPVDAYREAAEAAAARGIVGVVEFEGVDNLGEWPERIAAGVTSLRVQASVWPHFLDDAIDRGLRTGDAIEPSGLVTMGRVKVVVDGSLNTRTAWCHAPYPGLDPAADGAHGLRSVSPEVLREIVERADAAGILPAVHAIGDRAAAEVLDVFEALGIPGTIEHAQLVDAEDFARFGRLGVIASVQPEHAMDDRDVADEHWAGRTGRAFAFASLEAGGAELRLGSDAPVSPLDPWQAIAAAASRSRDGREPWHGEQTISVESALLASARGRGTVEVGDVADLIVLDTDPLTLDAAQLRHLPVAATLLAGRATWWGI